MATATALPLVPAEACCTPLSSAPLGRQQAQELAALLKAVADPTRLQLLSMVGAAGEGEACVCDLTDVLGLTQPTISHHLKVLVDAGLLTRDRRGSWAYFRLVRDRFNEIRALLDVA
jgi:ArsR family transcriptional regulator, arsenate/arsenite/antimonite-responsive transcriptional repressor